MCACRYGNTMNEYVQDFLSNYQEKINSKERHKMFEQMRLVSTLLPIFLTLLFFSYFLIQVMIYFFFF